MILIFVERRDVNTDKRTNESREGSPVERRKLRESIPIRTVEENTIECSKSLESNPVLRILSYANILIRNSLPS